MITVGSTVMFHKYIYTGSDYERLTLKPLNTNDSCEVPYVIDPDRPLPYQADE